MDEAIAARSLYQEADGQLLDLMGKIIPAVAEANSYGKLVEMLEAYFTPKV